MSGTTRFLVGGGGSYGERVGKPDWTFKGDLRDLEVFVVIARRGGPGMHYGVSWLRQMIKSCCCQVSRFQVRLLFTLLTSSIGDILRIAARLHLHGLHTLITGQYPYPQAQKRIGTSGDIK